LRFPLFSAAANRKRSLPFFPSSGSAFFDYPSSPIPFPSFPSNGLLHTSLLFFQKRRRPFPSLVSKSFFPLHTAVESFPLFSPSLGYRARQGSFFPFLRVPMTQSSGLCSFLRRKGCPSLVERLQLSFFLFPPPPSCDWPGFSSPEGVGDSFSYLWRGLLF